MTYRNRKKQLIQTLRSIKHSAVIDQAEVIIIDDASDPEHRIEDILEEFPFVKLTRIDPDQKTWKNPCIPYNMAFRMAKGDKIIIQNSESAHVGDVLKFVQNNLKPNVYYSFCCLSYPHVLTEKYCETDYFGKGDMTEAINISKGLGQPARFDGDLGWYNHPVYLPRGLHFCSAIMASDLNKVGGFDERFADGYNFDDNEFIWRLSSKQFDTQLVMEPFVIHQYHYTDCSIDMDSSRNALVEKNAKIFELLQSGMIPMWDKPLH